MNSIEVHYQINNLQIFFPILLSRLYFLSNFVLTTKLKKIIPLYLLLPDTYCVPRDTLDITDRLHWANPHLGGHAPQFEHHTE